MNGRYLLSKKKGGFEPDWLFTIKSFDLRSCGINNMGFGYRFITLGVILPSLY